MTNSTRSIAFAALFAALITVCSWISIPFAVPFTLQTFAVFITCIVLGGKLGFFTILTYIILGAAGLPVFAGFKGGLGALFGPTGGYILGFLLSALVIWIFTSIFSTKLPVIIASSALGLILCYAFGTIWFMHVYVQDGGTISLLSVLSMCVFPFIIPDIIKIALAIILGTRIKKLIPSANNNK